MGKISFELNQNHVGIIRLFDLYISFFNSEVFFEKYKEEFELNDKDKKWFPAILLARYDKEKNEEIKSFLHKYISKIAKDKDFNISVQKSVLVDIEKMDEKGNSIPNEKMSIILDCESDNDDVLEYIKDVLMWYDLTIEVSEFNKI